MPTAIAIIRDEHRSFSALLQGLLHLVAEIRAGRMAPDFRLLDAMLQYVEAFPERLHHPKEDEHLYRALRRRDPHAAAVLDALEAEHASGAARLARLGEAVETYRREGPGALEAFGQAVQEYADFHWAHMRKEEDEVLPLAERALAPEDWAAIDAAFASSADPLVGVDTRRRFRELFRRIVALAPPPLGVGPGRAP